MNVEKSVDFTDQRIQSIIYMLEIGQPNITDQVSGFVEFQSSKIKLSSTKIPLMDFTKLPD